MKKCLALFLALTLVFTMTACADNYAAWLNGAPTEPTVSQPEPESQPKPTTPSPGNTSSPSKGSDDDDSVQYASLAMFEKFGIIGDSYACGTIYVFEDGKVQYYGSYERLSWGQILARKLGTTCTNFSKGRLSTRTWLESESGLQALLAAEPQNIYYLMLGINDKEVYGNTGIGSLDDIKEDHNQNADTFYGNYGKIICEILNHAPDAKLIMSTMTGVTSLNKLYNDAIEEIAAHFGIPCVKQYESEFFNSDYYKKNLVNSHPTAPIYSGMANALQDLFEDAIRDNIDYFKDYVG